MIETQYIILSSDNYAYRVRINPDASRDDTVETGGIIIEYSDDGQNWLDNDNMTVAGESVRELYEVLGMLLGVVK